METERRMESELIDCAARIRLNSWAGRTAIGIIMGLLASWATLGRAAGEAAGADRTQAVDGQRNQAVRYNRDVLPILSRYCFSCHGPDAGSREADLRLDRFEDAVNAGAIVPGEPIESLIIDRMSSEDSDLVMPPPETEHEVTAAEKAVIEEWIRGGAAYEQHWAWSSLPVASGLQPPPENRVADGAKRIDEFLRREWLANNATAVGVATPRDRLRRLSFDLRGLPPRFEDVVKFVENPSDEAFFAFRDRWMSEPAYAEHQAVRWLDLVRWADTSGFVSDEPIASGAYRAWVIEAIRENQPFDEFSIAQLAGDLLDDRQDANLIASGYNRIVNTNCEAGAIETEQLYKLKGEHVRALGTVWMGLTTGCCECHDHKFDPLLAKDYYSLAAFFDDLVETGVYTPGDRREPLHYVYEDASVRKADRLLVEKIQALKSKVAARSVEQENQGSWEQEWKNALSDTKRRQDFVWIPGTVPAARVIEGQVLPLQIEGRWARESVAKSSEFRRQHVAELMTGFFKERDQITDSSKDGWFIDVWIDPENRPDMLGIQISHGRYGRVGWRTANFETYYWGEDTSGTLSATQPWSEPQRTKRVGAIPDGSGWVRLRVPESEWISPVQQQNFEATGMAWLHVGGRVAWSDSGLDLRRDKASALVLAETAMRRWWDQPFNRQVYQDRPKLVVGALRARAEARSGLQQAALEQACREQLQVQRMQRLRRLESKLHRLRSRSMPVLVSRAGRELKRTRLLARGDFSDESGDIMTPAIPEFLGRIETDGRATRLDLAKWLFDDDNPLTARVFVNRLWHQFFGRGISETLEDSGTQGDWPSHLELLDWLAIEFRDSGWDRNHMVRLLTSTHAYQLSSKPSKDLAERDPTNRWHARQGRFRLPAEVIRDAALQAAGLLRRTDSVPRASFFPYQPSAYWTSSDKIMYGSRHMNWATSPLDQQYSRSVYTFWKRQNIHPTLLAFDAPTRQECTAKRNITNTPGQALALLNDPIFVEAARVMATELVQNTDLRGDQELLELAFEMGLQRTPTSVETETLLGLLETLRQRYGDSNDDANSLTRIGQAQLPDDLDVCDVAAWTGVTRVILNLHEFLNRP